jgi:hypothetical protein
MTDAADHRDASLQLLREQLASGDIAGARRAMLQLSPRGRRELESRLGADKVARMFQVARKLRRGPSLGRVVVIHGIMGGKLAVHDAAGDDDLVWLNYLRLFNGRIADFALDASAQPVNPNVRVSTRGLLDEYLPMVMELSQSWDVLPFAFDWRLDIDLSAGALDREIRGWAEGQPVHIVAHSMGGLVSRRFIQLFPGTWAAMKDPFGLRRGGRLVMLGTPNRGSFAIPLVLTGQEKTVKNLATLDRKHDVRELLDIINTFPGSYQMVPTPKLAFGDDRMQLFDRATWGECPIPQAYLDKGRAFQEALHEVTDADRLIYVAGYNQRTPYRIRVDAPGQFSYQETYDGDGRVPHDLGLLPQVETFWVQERHGDLPSNSKVLAGIHNLLAAGKCDELEWPKPKERALPKPATWRKAEEIAPVQPLPGVQTRGGPLLELDEQALVERSMLEPFLGSGGASPAAGAPQHPEPEPGGPRKVAEVLSIEVMWGDITQVDGDVFVAGHYEGVEPQFGELALDKAISGLPKGRGKRDQLIITSHTRRGMLRGAVGDVNFFPWSGTRKTVAIAGMGRAGTFGPQNLRRLASTLAESISTLPGARTVNMLLIGSGAGNLNVGIAVAALLEGLADALGADTPQSSIRKVRIVERNLRHAQKIADALQAKGGALQRIRIVPGVQEGPCGRIEQEVAYSALLLAAAGRLPVKDAAATQKAVAEMLRGASRRPDLRQRCQEALLEIARKGTGDLLKRAAALDFGPSADEAGAAGAQTRISFIGDTAGVRAAAISDSAVVAERLQALDWSLAQEIVGRMTDPQDAVAMQDLSRLMARLFVPRDFSDLFAAGNDIVLEVDRQTAGIQWEMIDCPHETGNGWRALALDRPLARQLRTSYSPTPLAGSRAGTSLRALVIGDPGDPGKGLSLEGARREALEVGALLRSRGVEVDLLVGAPGPGRGAELQGIAPATTLDVLQLMEKNKYDILHYAGHGDFDPDDPQQRAGWIFGERYFTAREIASLGTVPGLVVANACLSAQTSNRHGGNGNAQRLADDTLLPGLVDEFFKRGVRNYVGTAWPVSDTGAILFCNVLYEILLPDDRLAGTPTLGQAMLAARKALKQQESNFGALWAAYQHYGDPGFVLREAAWKPAEVRPRAHGRERRAEK